MKEEDRENFNLELQALESMYPDDVSFTNSGLSGDINEVKLFVTPATGEDVLKQYLSIEVIFRIPNEYPHAVPVIEYRNPRGLADEELDNLRTSLNRLAIDSMGSDMLLPLADTVRECLTSLNASPHGQCCVCLEDFVENEGITRTICAHYLHSHCLADYIAHSEKEKAKAKVKESSGNNAKEGVLPDKVYPCPVCRVPMQPLDMILLRKQALPVDKPPPTVDIHSETLRQQQKEFFTQIRKDREKRLAEEERKAAIAFQEACIKASQASDDSLVGQMETLEVREKTKRDSTDLGIFAANSQEEDSVVKAPFHDDREISKKERFGSGGRFRMNRDQRPKPCDSQKYSQSGSESRQSRQAYRHPAPAYFYSKQRSYSGRSQEKNPSGSSSPRRIGQGETSSQPPQSQRGHRRTTTSSNKDFREYSNKGAQN